MEAGRAIGVAEVQGTESPPWPFHIQKSLTRLSSAKIHYGMISVHWYKLRPVDAPSTGNHLEETFANCKMCAIKISK